MSNLNNNRNFNDWDLEALRINRALKKRLDKCEKDSKDNVIKANAIVDKLLELEIYITGLIATQSVSGAGTRDYEDMLIELKEILDE